MKLTPQHIKKLIKEELNSLFEQELISELYVKGDPNGKNIVAYKQNLWRFDAEDPGKVRSSINYILNLPSKNWRNFTELAKQMITSDFGQEALLGTLLVNPDGTTTLELEQTGAFAIDPKSSVLVKKVAKQLGVSNVTTGETEFNKNTRQVTPFGQATGRVSNVMYHGTSTMYLGNLLRLGLVPGKSETNFEGLSHPKAVFFTSNLAKALGHAEHTSEKVGGEPVIIELRVPDSNLLMPDYDVDTLSVNGDACYDYVCSAYRAFGPKLKIDSMALSRELGIFGYNGRVPASHLKGYYLLKDPEVRTNSINDFKKVNPKVALQFSKTPRATAKKQSTPVADETDEFGLPPGIVI